MLLAQVAQFDGGFGLAVLRAVALLLALLDQAGQRLTVGQERLGVVRLRQLQRAGEVVIAFGGMLAALLVRFQPGDFLPDRRQAVTAVLGDGAGQFVAFRLALPLVLLQRAALLALAGDVLGEVIQALVQQLGLEPGEPGRQRFAAGDQPLRLLRGFGVTLAVVHHRSQQADLPLGLEHRLVGAIEIVEVVDQRLDAFVQRKLLEHVFADEIGEVAHRFHRYGLAEQLQRLVVGDAEAAAEGGAVGGEAGFELDVGQLAQAFAQGVEVAAEAGEVFGDRQRTVRDDIEAFRLAAVVADVEHLGEG